MRDPDALPAWLARQLGRVRDRRGDDKIVRWFYRRAAKGQSSNGSAHDTGSALAGIGDTALLHPGPQSQIH